MLSAPDEDYRDHIENCLNEWKKLSLRFLPTLTRLFGRPCQEIEEAVSLMLFCHDVGKLTRRWQEKIEKREAPPPHSAISSAYLLELNKSKDDNIAKASCFAVLIHHIDRTVVGNNLESPDAQAILRGLIKGDEILWHNDAEGFLEEFSKESEQSYLPLSRVRLKSLSELSEELRLWSKPPRLLEQHRNRLLVASLHHILRVCDWRASLHRKENERERASILECLRYGGLLV
jgi:CRISPR-associated endonuclease Cas3-HD